MLWFWRYLSLGVRFLGITGVRINCWTELWARGHQCREAPIAQQSGTHMKALPAHQSEEQWAKGRVLMHTNYHAKLFVVLTFGPHTSVIRVHSDDDKHSPFINTKALQGPSQDLLWHTIEGFLKVDIGRVGRFVSSNVLATGRQCSWQQSYLYQAQSSSYISLVFTTMHMEKFSTHFSSFMAGSGHLRSRKLSWSKDLPLPL